MMNPHNKYNSLKVQCPVLYVMSAIDDDNVFFSYLFIQSFALKFVIIIGYGTITF